jgi:hypothetical protein
MRRCQSYRPEDSSPTPQDALELIDRCMLTLIDPAMLGTIASYASAAQSASTQHNIATAQNINSPNSSQFVSSTTG